ncbi:MAG TPA: hypothetical protein VGI28_01815 [Stellaceae bacterium]|jgi:hypothetical protein
MVSGPVVGGAISGIGSLVGGATASSASQQAAQSQLAAQQAADATALQEQQQAENFSSAYFGNAAQYLSPLINAGQGVGSELLREMGAPFGVGTPPAAAASTLPAPASTGTPGSTGPPAAGGAAQQVTLPDGTVVTAQDLQYDPATGQIAFGSQSGDLPASDQAAAQALLYPSTPAAASAATATPPSNLVPGGAIPAAAAAQSSGWAGAPPAGSLGAMPSLTDLSQLPGFSSTMYYGQQGVANAAAAQGLGVSGAALKGAGQYAATTANQFYNNYFSNYWANQNNRYNMLSGLMNTGANAANSLAGYSTNTGVQGASNITSISNAMTGLAGQIAPSVGAAQQASGNLLGAGISGAANQFGAAANVLMNQGSGGTTLGPSGGTFATSPTGDYGGGGDY